MTSCEVGMSFELRMSFNLSISFLRSFYNIPNDININFRGAKIRETYTLEASASKTALNRSRESVWEITPSLVSSVKHTAQIYSVPSNDSLHMNEIERVHTIRSSFCARVLRQAMLSIPRAKRWGGEGATTSKIFHQTGRLCARTCETRPENTEIRVYATDISNTKHCQVSISAYIIWQVSLKGEHEATPPTTLHRRKVRGSGGTLTELTWKKTYWIELREL